MGNDLESYRMRIGAFNIMKNWNKLGERFSRSGVSTWIIIQILLILLMIGGVELNPGPDDYKDIYLKEVEKEITDLREVLKKVDATD